MDDEITVEQAAVIMARYATYAGVYEPTYYDMGDYEDADMVSYWAKDQMMWALENGIYEGKYGKLSPSAPAKRALVAEIFHRYAEAFAK